MDELLLQDLKEMRETIDSTNASFVETKQTLEEKILVISQLTELVPSETKYLSLTMKDLLQKLERSYHLLATTDKQQSRILSQFEKFDASSEAISKLSKVFDAVKEKCEEIKSHEVEGLVSENQILRQRLQDQGKLINDVELRIQEFRKERKREMEDWKKERASLQRHILKLEKASKEEVEEGPVLVPETQSTPSTNAERCSWTSGEICKLLAQTPVALRPLSFRGNALVSLDLDRCDFTRCHFQQAEMNGCDLNDSVFLEVDAAASTWNKCRLEKSELKSSNWKGASLRSVDFTSATFSDCILEEVTLRDCIFLRTSFTKCSLVRAICRGIRLQQCVCQDLTWDYCNMENSTLQHIARDGPISFFNSKASGSDWRGLDLNHAQMNGCELTGSRLDGCDLSHATLVNVQADGTVFDGAILWATSFRGASLVRASFAGCIWRGTVMVGWWVGADLRRANLQGMQGPKGLLTENDFVGCTIGEGTVLPNGKRVDITRVVVSASPTKKQ